MRILFRVDCSLALVFADNSRWVTKFKFVAPRLVVSAGRRWAALGHVVIFGRAGPKVHMCREAAHFRLGRHFRFWAGLTFGSTTSPNGFGLQRNTITLNGFETRPIFNCLES